MGRGLQRKVDNRLTLEPAGQKGFAAGDKSLVTALTE